MITLSQYASFICASVSTGRLNGLYDSTSFSSTLFRTKHAILGWKFEAEPVIFVVTHVILQLSQGAQTLPCAML